MCCGHLDHSKSEFIDVVVAKSGLCISLKTAFFSLFLALWRSVLKSNLQWLNPVEPVSLEVTLFSFWPSYWSIQAQIWSISSLCFNQYLLESNNKSTFIFSPCRALPSSLVRSLSVKLWRSVAERVPVLYSNLAMNILVFFFLKRKNKKWTRQKMPQINRKWFCFSPRFYNHIRSGAYRVTLSLSVANLIS